MNNYPTNAMFPRVSLKDMDAAMLLFELSRNTDELFCGGSDSHAAARAKITSAAMVATHLHAGQTRMVRQNMPRTPYIEHPLRDAVRLIRWGSRDVDTIVMALLHDTLEDSVLVICQDFVGHVADDQDSNFAAAQEWMLDAYGPEVYDAVMDLTLDRTNSWLVNVRAMLIGGNLRSKLGKASDLCDNAGSLIHQFGHVKNSFIIKLLDKYTPGVHEVAASLEIDIASGLAHEQGMLVETTNAVASLKALSITLEQLSAKVLDLR